ncbi:phospholipid carrier-dependent glycosyltransferase [Patescibacteria group bacterium]|nr:phospholipid carrier-dependent glycosyltransferase [Patescibacteria group bacterium]
MSKLSKSQKLLCALLVLAAFMGRLYKLSTPVEWVFDEVYHALSAEMYALNDPRGYEWWHVSPPDLAYEWLHPPVGKLMMAGSIQLFYKPFYPFSKDNPPLDYKTTFAWRFPSAVCTSLTVLVIVLLGTRMFNFSTGFLAGLFYAIDPLAITHGRLGTSDGIFAFFSTLSFYQLYVFLAEYPGKYLQNLIFLGLSLGLAISTKFTGVFNIFWATLLVGAAFIYRREAVKQLLTSLIILALTVLNVYLFSYFQWWLQGHTWEQFFELHNQIFRYHVDLRATHPYSSPPLSWPLMLKPAWLYAGYDASGKSLNIYATGNKLTWYGGVLAVVYFLSGLFGRLYKALKLKKFTNFFTASNLKIAFLLTAYFGMFLPWVLSPRIMFIYHYLPSLPFLFLLLAHFLHRFCKMLWLRYNSTVNEPLTPPFDKKGII